MSGAQIGSHRWLDTRFGVDSPEGVSISLAPAGPIPRALAWVLDLLLRGVVYMVAGIALAALGRAGLALLALLAFLLEWFYPVLFEVLNRGVTPGKAALGLAVVEEDGRPVGWSSSTVRNFLRYADFMPFAFFAGVLSMLFTQRFQRLGDLAAGTLVIHRQRPKKNVRVTLPAVPSLAPTVAIDASEQHALVALASRHARLSTERLDELAALAPALTGHTPAQQRLRLLGIARYLAGGHDHASVDAAASAVKNTAVDTQPNSTAQHSTAQRPQGPQYPQVPPQVLP